MSDEKHWGLKLSFMLLGKILLKLLLYNISNIHRVQCMKDLGVYVTSDLSWNSHINTLESKCNSMI